MNSKVGILAYGSVNAEPGDEIKSSTVKIIRGVTTPFNVEFARKSSKRGGAPTLVPVTELGAPVEAQIFVVDIELEEAVNQLYRREINQVGSEHIYNPPKTPRLNTVIIRRLVSFSGLNHVVYTELAATISPLNAKELARLAIDSARGSTDGRDGITYLIHTKRYGITTHLSTDYEREILAQMEADDLHEALEKARNG